MTFDHVLDAVTHRVKLGRRSAEETLSKVLVERRKQLVAKSVAQIAVIFARK